MATVAEEEHSGEGFGRGVFQDMFSAPVRSVWALAGFLPIATVASSLLGWRVDRRSARRLGKW